MVDYKSKNKILKNIILLSFAFFLNSNAFQSLIRLQSSIHYIDGLGTLTTSIIYVTTVLTCLIMPKLLISLIGYKWTIFVSLFGYILYSAANGYATWVTMVITAIFIGLSSAPLWTSTFSYFAIEAVKYAEATGQTFDSVLTMFFGTFFMFYQAAGLTGAVISATILKLDEENVISFTRNMSVCGMNDCPWNQASENLILPADQTVWIMVGVYMGSAILALIIVGVFVDPITEVDTPKFTRVEFIKNVKATFRQTITKYQLLLIPITMYSGFEQAYFNAEFSKSFVACSVGIWKVGLVTLPYAAVNATFSFFMGHISKYTGKFILLTLAFMIDLSLNISLYTWNPKPEEEIVLYIIAAFWGLSDSIWQTQVNAIYGTILKDIEAGFANYSLWEAIAFIMAFAYSTFLCTLVKTIILTSILVLGILGYYAIEISEKMKKNKKEAIEIAKNVSTVKL